MKVLQELQCPSPLAPSKEAVDDENREELPEKGFAKKGKKQNKKPLKGNSAGSKPKPSKNVELKASDSAEGQGPCVYKAGNYREAMWAFVRQLKSEGCSHSEACNRWKVCDARAELLKNMPLAERKRRRFED